MNGSYHLWAGSPENAFKSKNHIFHYYCFRKHSDFNHLIKDFNEDLQ